MTDEPLNIELTRDVEKGEAFEMVPMHLISVQAPAPHQDTEIPSSLIPSAPDHEPIVRTIYQTTPTSQFYVPSTKEVVMPITNQMKFKIVRARKSVNHQLETLLPKNRDFKPLGKQKLPDVKSVRQLSQASLSVKELTFSPESTTRKLEPSVSLRVQRRTIELA
jgi:hypothetical protein